MTSARWKFFLDYEKEEKWLNEMSAKGFAFRDYCFGRYTFTDSEPGEYIYRIELLQNYPGHPESRKYIGFMEANGVEAVASWFAWVYFRKKAQDGSFDIYSDIESRLIHFRRVATTYLTLGILASLFGLNASLQWLFQTWETPDFLPLLLASPLLLCLGGACLFLWNGKRKTIKRLKQEQRLKES
jgi:hypothetical protein